MNVFKLVGSFMIKGVDEANAKIKAVATSARTGFGDAETAAGRASTAIAGGVKRLGGALGTAAKVGAAALLTTATVAAGALGSVAKSSLDAYASFEQLTGGVETLFKGSAGVVEEYAANAYKTAGMSANAYMETVTSFSASLLQGLGGDTAAAAEYANTAVTDMSDNANKMGTSISSIQDAYQGFAKQNYTMLDNLKLGYGGTQSEMARLINDSGVLGDAMTVTAETVNQVSFDKVVEAVHVVQTEMGITGTTAMEAASTIEGSVNSAKAAWANWLTGLADENANMDLLTSQLIQSVVTAAKNIAPRIVEILSSLGTTLAENLPRIIEQVRITLVTYGPMLLAAAAELFRMIFQGLVENGPAVLSGLLDLLNQLVLYLIENMPAILDGAITLFGGVLSALGQAAPQILAGLLMLLGSLVLAIVNKVGEMFSSGMEFIGGLLDGIGSVDVLGFLDGVIRSITGAFDGAGSWLMDAGWNLLQGLWGGIQGGLDWLGGQLAGIGDFIVQHKGPPAKDRVMLKGNGALITRGLVDGIRSGIPELERALSGISSGIASHDLSADMGSGSSSFVETQGARAARGSRAEQLLDAILSQLQELTAKCSPDRQVVMDTGALVGQLAEPMYGAFVSMEKRRLR